MGLESDTPFYEAPRNVPCSFYAGEGDGDLAFPPYISVTVQPGGGGKLRGTATMGNKGTRARERERDHPCARLLASLFPPPPPLNLRLQITFHSSRLEIYYAGGRSAKKRRSLRAAPFCRDVTRRGETQLPRSPLRNPPLPLLFSLLRVGDRGCSLPPSPSPPFPSVLPSVYSRVKIPVVSYTIKCITKCKPFSELGFWELGSNILRFNDLAWGGGRGGGKRVEIWRDGFSI